MTMQEYNGNLIEGRAAMIHPYDPNHYPAGVILRHGRAGSIIEVGRVELPSFSVDLPALPKWFRLELG